MKIAALNVHTDSTAMNRAELLANPQLYFSRAQACLLGLAAGDAIGDAGRTQEYRARYGLVDDLYPGLANTDDTEFSVLTARALLDAHGHLTPASVAQAWRCYVLEQGGIQERAGKPLIGAAENLKRGMQPPLTGLDNVMNNDDGAAMRAAPIGILYAGQPALAAAQAAVDAEVSHAGDGVWAAQAVAAAFSLAMVGVSPQEIFEIAMQQVPPDSWLGRAMEHCYQLCQSSAGIADAWRALHDDFWTPAHSASPEAIPQIFGVFYLIRGDFHQGLIWSANFGRDADTIAAVVCALNAARLGLEAIPEDWIERLQRPTGVCLRFAARENLLDLADRLVELALKMG